MNNTITKLQAYDNYKPSGVEWLGDIPEHWEVLPGLSFIFENKDRNKGMKRNTVLSLSYGKIRVKSENELTGLVPESFETYQFVNKGDLIFRPTDLQNDTVSLRSSISEYEGIITNAYLNLRFKSKANSKFYHYFFRSIDNNKIIYGLGSGLRQNISYLDFRRFQFPFPPLKEQIGIAQFLDDKTTKIDQAIAIKQKQIDLLKERRQILIHKAVTQGINPNVKLKDSGVEWIGEIPEHWNTIKFSILIEKYDLGGDYNSSYEAGGIPLIKMGNIGRGKIELNKIEYLEINKKIPKSGFLCTNDFLFNTRNSYELVGKVTLWGDELPRATFNLNILRIKFTNRIQNQFMNYLFNSDSTLSVLKLIAKGTTNVSAIYFKDLSKLKFQIPPIQEQKEISDYIENATNKIAITISIKEQEIEKLKEYKSSLTDGVVTGKVRVC